VLRATGTDYRWLTPETPCRQWPAAVRQFAAWQQTRKTQTDRLEALQGGVDALEKALEDVHNQLKKARGER
jgi:hypothetical protein